MPNSTARANVLSLRLSEIERRYLVVRASRAGVGLSTAMRQLLNDALDQEPGVVTYDEGPDSVKSTVPLRQMLGIATDEGIDDLARQLPPEAADAQDA